MSADSHASAPAAQSVRCVSTDDILSEGLAVLKSTDESTFAEYHNKICCCSVHCFILLSCQYHRGWGRGGQTFWTGTTAKSQRAIHSASSSTAGSNIKQGGASQKERETEGNSVCLNVWQGNLPQNKQTVDEVLLRAHTVTETGNTRSRTK